MDQGETSPIKRTLPARLFSFSLRTLLIAITLLCLGLAWIPYRSSQIAERERLEKQFASSGVYLTFADSLFGWEMPDAPYGESGWTCGLGYKPIPPDDWRLIRPASAPVLRAVVVYQDEPLPADVAAVAQNAREIYVCGKGEADSLLDTCLSTETEKLVFYGGISELNKCLSRCPNLRSVSLSKGGVDDLEALLSRAGIRDVRWCGSARELSQMNVAGASDVETMEVGFDDEDPFVEEEDSFAVGDFSWLRKCQHLEELTLVWRWDRAFLEAVGRMRGGVERLTMSSHTGDFAESSLADLRDWSRLRHLNLQSVRVTDELIASIVENCPQLESLELDGSGSEGELTPLGVSRLSEMPSLKRLALEGCGLTRYHISAIATCRDLQELSLAENYELRDRHLRPLRTLQRLRLLYVDHGSWISDRCFRRIRGEWKKQPPRVNDRPLVVVG